MTKNFTEVPAYRKLEIAFEQIKHVRIANLTSKKSHVEEFTIREGEFLFDFSKNFINSDVIHAFTEIANQIEFEKQRSAFFAGEVINETEHRAVLHTLLRDFGSDVFMLEGKDILPEVQQERAKLAKFAEKAHHKQLFGYSGKAITQFVNIGIGGSDLGPVMVCEALKPYWGENLEVYFVSNVDGSHFAEISKKLNPETTLFFITSKTFTTQETMTNAESARNWFLNSGGNNEAISNHFVALSTNIQAAKTFGISEDNVFKFWDWVGGRYSLWSAIGLPIACAIGYENFEQLLRGAFALDNHFKKSPLHKNIPFLMAIIGIWNQHFFNAHSSAVLPYDQYLHRFPAYLQQADMESNGKTIDKNGKKINFHSGPIIWGEPGTNGQHSFYQLIHQGSKLIPCDFIASIESHNPISDHHPKLLANFFAQPEALMNGLSREEVIEDFKAKNNWIAESEKIVPFKIFEGNRPSNSILIKKLCPFNLGFLIAAYEQKIFTQGVFWNVFSFDQFGVELGKKLASKILPELLEKAIPSNHDYSTLQLIKEYLAQKK